MCLIAIDNFQTTVTWANLHTIGHDLNNYLPNKYHMFQLDAVFLFVFVSFFTLPIFKVDAL